MKQADIDVLEAARVLLTKGFVAGKLHAARRKIGTVSARAEVVHLEEAVDALIVMEKAPPADAVALAERVEHAARTYWNEPGPVRPAAMTAMVVGAAMCAERLAAMGETAKAISRLTAAKSLQHSLVRGRVHGLDAVEERVRSAVGKPAASGGKAAPKAGKPRPRAKAALAKARSFRRGTLSPPDLAAMAKLVERPDLREMASEMEAFDGDAILCEGDLRVDGDFRTSDAGVVWLVVKGDLIVDGLYEDTCNDAPDHVFIAGSLRAADVVTAGALDVGGDLIAKGVIVGDYNDGDAHVHGDLKARLFAPYDHSFRIGGKVQADVLGRRPGETTPGVTSRSWSEIELAECFAEDDLIKRLRKRLPILA